MAGTIFTPTSHASTVAHACGVGERAAVLAGALWLIEGRVEEVVVGEVDDGMLVEGRLWPAVVGAAEAIEADFPC